MSLVITIGIVLWFRWGEAWRVFVVNTRNFPVSQTAKLHSKFSAIINFLRLKCNQHFHILIFINQRFSILHYPQITLNKWIINHRCTIIFPKQRFYISFFYRRTKKEENQSLIYFGVETHWFHFFNDFCSLSLSSFNWFFIYS